MKLLKTIKLVLTLRCKDAARLLSGDCDRELKAAEKAALRLHLLMCGSCKRYQKQLKYLRGLFGEARQRLFGESGLPKAPDTLRRRIVEAIRKRGKQ